MRGPLLSGALGSPATLDRVSDLVRTRLPVVVLSTLWLAEVLATEMPVLALVEEQKRKAALRVKRRGDKTARPLSFVVAASEVPLARESVGSVVLDSLVEIEDQAAASDLLVGLLPALRPDGLVISLDATKSPALETRVSEIFLAASMARITQLRPREGALITMAYAPHPAVIKARVRGLLAEP